ncbi:hypothetical protein BMIN10S_02126 [Bosea minatitlanensis]
MPRRLCLPATLFGNAIGSRALTGFGPTGVAGALRMVLQRNALRSLAFSRSQHLQHLQRPFASRVHRRGRAQARAGASTRGFGPVASVASVADDKSIYISIGYLQHPLQRLASALAQGVADHPCSIGSAAPQAIKYPRIFKGLRVARSAGGGNLGNGVLAMRAPGSRRRAGRSDQGRARPLGLALARPAPAVFASDPPPVASEIVRYQVLSLPVFVSAASIWGGSLAFGPHPPSLPDPHPPEPPAPFSAARLAAPAGPSEGFPDRGGENADRWGAGSKGSGAPGSGAAKTGVLEKAGSGEVWHG